MTLRPTFDPSNSVDLGCGVSSRDWAHQSPHSTSHSLQLQKPADVARALASDAVARRVMAKGVELLAGDVIGVRLNLNIAKAGVLVHTIHRGTPNGGHQRGRGLWNGEVIGYEDFVVLRDAYFNVSQPGREVIAAGGKAKFPMASIDGHLLTLRRPRATRSVVGIEVSFNPKRVHLFVDPDGRAIRCAEEVTIVGHRAYARGRLEYFNPETAPKRAGQAPTAAHFGGDSIQSALASASAPVI